MNSKDRAERKYQEAVDRAVKAYDVALKPVMSNEAAKKPRGDFNQSVAKAEADYQRDTENLTEEVKACLSTLPGLFSL